MNSKHSLKNFIKSHFRGIYDFAGAVYHGFDAAKARRLSESEATTTHDSTVSADAPLKLLAVNTGSNRFNIVFKNFSKKTLEDKNTAEFLKIAVNFANAHDFSLRIISRNSQPNPRVFCDFLKLHQLDTPKNYSFYTDSASRLSSSVRRLDVSRNDYIFTENEIDKLKDWIKKYE